MIAIIPTVAVGLPLIQALVGGGSGAALSGGLSSFNRQRAPQLSAGDIGAAAKQIAVLRQRGLEPFVATDPETGNLVVGSRDQDIGGLVAERNLRALLTPTPDELREYTRQVLLRRQSLDPGTSPAVPQAVAQPTITARVMAPGTVIRGNRTPAIRSSVTAMLSRHGGPCAGATSSLARIRCNIGGLT